jgi:hypothetical protein
MEYDPAALSLLIKVCNSIKPKVTVGHLAAVCMHGGEQRRKNGGRLAEEGSGSHKDRKDLLEVPSGPTRSAWKWCTLGLAYRKGHQPLYVGFKVLSRFIQKSI